GPYCRQHSTEVFTMVFRFLDAAHGCGHWVLRAISKFVAMGLTERDVIKLMRWHNARHKKPPMAVLTATRALDRQERLQLGQWAILTLLDLGFCKSEIATIAGVDHSSIVRAVHPT